MTTRVTRHGLQVAAELADFIETRALPGTGVDADRFWEGMSELVNGFGPENRDLLEKREEIQRLIDDWHKTHRNHPHDHSALHFLLP